MLAAAVTTSAAPFASWPIPLAVLTAPRAAKPSDDGSTELTAEVIAFFASSALFLVQRPGFFPLNFSAASATRKFTRSVLLLNFCPNSPALFFRKCTLPWFPGWFLLTPRAGFRDENFAFSSARALDLPAPPL